MFKIFIDAGHGGKDTGAVNGSVLEKDIALKIALKLNAILQSHGFQTQLSRETDVFVKLNERARKANLFNADIFVSVHLNSATNPSANGTETLVFENKGESHKIASHIQNKLTEAIFTTNRGIKERCDLCVLNSTKMPAVLVEVGFLSNEKEKQLLVSEVWQNKIARAIADGILKYFGLEVSKTVNTVDEALKILKDKGIVNSADYWKKAVDVVKYLDKLLINAAEKIG